MIKIKCNDKISIKNPHFYLRCGYELSVQEQAKLIYEKYSSELNQLISNIIENETGNPLYSDKIEYKGFSIPAENSFLLDKTKQIICSSLAYFKCKKLNFGGNERKIITIHIPELENTFFEVKNVKFCRTGMRSTYNIYEDDYQIGVSPYLANVKNHRILELSDIYNDFLYEKYGDIIHNLMIEDCNVQKV